MAVKSARGAPLPEGSALVAEPQVQELVQRSLTLLEKIMQDIEVTHKSCVTVKGLTELNSPENAKLVNIASTIGIPSAPVLMLNTVTLETCLKNISEGLQLHQALLSAISSHLEDRDKVDTLKADIKDLVLQIHKMLKTVNGEAVQATPPAMPLNLSGGYEIQVATHLTLVQLQAFGRDVERYLRTLDQSSEEDTER